jgi:hypothetical protein
MQEGGSKVANAKTGVPELRPGEPKKGGEERVEKVEKWEKVWRGKRREKRKHMA